MISIRKAVVTAIDRQERGMVWGRAQLGEEERRFQAYLALTGPLSPGDEVLLNTTAVDLALGSGGWDYVLTGPGYAQTNLLPTGHIMKLRYTSLQIQTLSLEEEGSPLRETYLQTEDLGGIPVILGSLHSQLVPAAVGYALAGGLRLAYCMTDGAALPLAMSEAVHELKERGLLVGTVSLGHAFGGDYEAVNLHSALLGARAAWDAQAIVVLMGPGVVGTGTPFGSTAMEVAEGIHATTALGGRPLVIPRISFADPRPRHQGVSHHTLTVLDRLALAQATVAVPRLSGEERETIWGQLNPLRSKHTLIEVEADRLWDGLGAQNLQVRSMGRGPSDDPAFFLAAAAAGLLAGEGWT